MGSLVGCKTFYTPIIRLTVGATPPLGVVAPSDWVTWRQLGSSRDLFPPGLAGGAQRHRAEQAGRPWEKECGPSLTARSRGAGSDSESSVWLCSLDRAVQVGGTPPVFKEHISPFRRYWTDLFHPDGLAPSDRAWSGLRQDWGRSQATLMVSGTARPKLASFPWRA